MTEPTTEPGNDVDAATEPLFETPPLAEQERKVEEILFASAEPVTIADMSARLPPG